MIANAVENEDEMLEAVRHAIGADTLGYISLRGMVAASEQPTSRLCTACFDGKYPIELPRETALGKMSSSTCSPMRPAEPRWANSPPTTKSPLGADKTHAR